MDMHAIDARNPRTLAGYAKILTMKSRSTQKLFQCTVNNVKSFGKIDLSSMEKYDEDQICDLLQEWIVWNNDRGIAASSIMCYFNTLRSYLWYCKANVDWRYIQQNLTFPQMMYPSKHPITPAIIKKLLSVSKQDFRFQILALLSSGMRVGELGRIRTSHLDFANANIMVRIPANITKTGRSRITFFSRQVSSMIRYRIKHRGMEFTFCEGRTPDQSLNLIIKRFASARSKAGITEMHEHCKQNRYTIHVHSLRSYFVTRANQIQFGLGHILAGHNFYMKEYNQYTIEELLGMYKKIERELQF